MGTSDSESCTKTFAGSRNMAEMRMRKETSAISPQQVTGSVPMDVGHLPLLARLSGTLSPRTCGIRRFLRTVTAMFSALEFLLTKMCYTNHLTWHLTFDSRVGFRSRRYFRFDQIQDGGRPLPLTRPLLNKDEILKKIMVYRDSVSLDSHTDILMCCELLWKPTPHVSYASPLK